VTDHPPPGVAAERTLLAWNRTTLGYVVCLLLCVRLAADSPPLALTVVGLGGGGLAALAAAGRSRYRRIRPVAAEGPVAAPTAVGTAAALVVLLGVGAAMLVLAR
jgi:uncharacterized membrane protein YidH (DUF202 family)